METAFVTGASSGIGKATALRLLDDGLKVYVAARRVKPMQELVDRGAIAIAMDITKEADVVAAVEQIARKSGGVDVLVNNAGFGLYGPVEDIEIDQARYQFEVNLFGLGRLTQLVLPHMRKQGRGKIINISSVGGRIYMPLGAWYHASKHALEGWSDCLRLDVAPFGIHVVLIRPGFINTEFADTLGSEFPEHSRDGPYGDLVQRFERAGESTNPASFSSPDVIAKVISKAVQSRKPKTRYAAGSMAKPMLFMRKMLSDRMFDRLIMSQMK